MEYIKMFNPFGSRVFLKIELESTPEGLIIPDVAKRSLEKAIGHVLEVGPDCVSCKPDMRVLLSKYSGLEMQIDGISYRVVHEEDIAGEFLEQTIEAKTEERL